MTLAGQLPEDVFRFLVRLVPFEAYLGLAVGVAVIVLLAKARRAAARSSASGSSG
ncbi:hypothetical protein AB0M39_17625 [Streptomyces sp. NPDC051907]|uniref:hypothetical protein n=1 Tax=Streptomyces sp. NPDC051907 TaxID=3155284 RepID=UPI0034424AEA